ncbi:uncharacterized protein LOC113312175 [Papaver somniferum]|uniref:uncharacterized protein LOC113312175 n=1 Tax=Papaver somniferum TaxID=3469 RepID=UPI000E7045D9|nr:uncharacterized protein LOC113312175 [Papaver somniferum]
MRHTTEDNPKCFISDDDIEESLNEWKYSLIGRLDFIKLKIQTTYSILRKQWKTRGSIQLIPLGKGFFVIKLDNEEDKQHIWSGDWKVEDQSLKLRVWEPKFKPEEQKSTSAFVWVQFPRLGMEYWKEKIILNMGNSLGRSIKVDETTLKREIGYYASVLVEMDVSKFIPNKIRVESKYGSFEQRVHIPKVKNKNKVGFDICFGEEETSQNSQHTHSLDSEDEIIDAIIPPISQGGGGETLAGSFQNANEEEVNSVIPPLVKTGSNVENNQVKQKAGTNVTTRKQAASLVSTFSKNGNLRREPKIRYSTDFIKKLKLSGMYYEVIHNSTDENKGNIWILCSASIKPPTIISCTRQEITIAVGDTLITGVHVASLTVDRRELCNNMEEINSLNKPWLVIGDFNVVTCQDEKVGGLKPLRISMLEFNNCLNRCVLIQSPKTGLEFSWCNNIVGRKRIVCNLDRVVFNDKWLELYPSLGHKVGARGISDLGVLYGANADIPKPENVLFRALKVSKNHPSFKQAIIDSWSSEIFGNPGFIFMSKLKRLKKHIQIWNLNSFGDVTKKLKQVEEDVLKATLLSDRNPLDLHLLNNVIATKGKQELLLDQQKEIIQQKSRVKWLKEGAANTRFFHEVTFATNIFNDIPIVVNEDENSLLEAIPKADEIREAVFELNPDSAPGPDGFAGWSYREVWEIIGKDFINAIQFWWSRRFIPNGLNANFLLLLPKVKNVKRANQFRPIGLMNFSFKVITKIITKRLTEIIKKVVSPQQGAFIKGRNIQEKIALASELVNDMEYKRRADDIFIFGNADKRNVRKLLKVLQDYQAASGQVISLEKSKCFIGGTSEARKLEIPKVCNMPLSKFPDKYLGVMLEPRRIKSIHLWSIVEMMQENLAGWKGRLLSFQERLILVKFLLCSLSIYTMAVYKWPKTIIKECESIIRNFVWTGDPSTRKVITLKWGSVCSPMDEGGLGLRRLEILNKPLLMKLYWKILNGEDEMSRYFQAEYQDKNSDWIQY